MAYFPLRCQHIKVNGTQCGCPALRRHKLCYFHTRHHNERVQLNLDRANAKPVRGRRRPAMLDLPVLEDANAIQVSLSQIIRLIVTGEIDGKAAGLVLYALQTASTNLRNTSFEPVLQTIILDPKTVGETPLRALAWTDSDFESDSDEDEEANELAQEAMRNEALKKAKRALRKNAELERWANAEADRLAEEGKREYEAEQRRILLTEAALDADLARGEKNRIERQEMELQEKKRRTIEKHEIDRQEARQRLSTASGVPANLSGTELQTIPAAEPPPDLPPRRPPGKASIDEVRTRLTEQVRQLLPDLVSHLAQKKDKAGGQ